MKTLYTAHVTIERHDIYSFIYADTLLEAEDYLKNLLNRYMREHYLPAPLALPPIRVVSRPQGWTPPDGYYLPPTSKQYALRYPSPSLPTVAHEIPSMLEEPALSLELPPISLNSAITPTLPKQ